MQFTVNAKLPEVLGELDNKSLQGNLRNMSRVKTSCACLALLSLLSLLSLLCLMLTVSPWAQQDHDRRNLGVYAIQRRMEMLSVPC